MAYKVTIGIPVYNVGKHIRQTLDSVLGQTFPDIEILICDDCGTDDSIDIVKEYQQTHPRGRDIRILHQPHNMGIGAGRNRMIAEAKGQYFYSIDADDTIALNTIELLYNTAQQYHAEIVYGSFERVFEHDGQLVRKVQYQYPKRVFASSDEYSMYAYYRWIQGMIPTYVSGAVLLPDITYQYYIRSSSTQIKKKKILSREQMLLSLDALDKKKARYELKGKPYYAKRISWLMMWDCSFGCEMLLRRKDFDVPFTNREIRDRMWHPMSLHEILMSNSARKQNLFYYLIGKLPPALSVFLLKLLGKRHGVGI